MRKKADRATCILEMLTKEHRIEVSQLAEELHVSQVTMRKDLDELEQRGIIKREHGFAVLQNTDDLGTRIAYHYEAKKKIAREAARMISDGDTIMIENGSCCALLADVLTEIRKDLTIITNSAFIASYIRGKAGFQTILLGGIYQQDSQVMVGPMVAECARNFFVNYFFIGTDGFSEKMGFTNRDQMRTQAVRDMSRQAEHIVVLTESEKFHHLGVIPMNLQEQISMVITDNAIPETSVNILKSQDIQVITVET